MRVSPVADAYETQDEVLHHAERTAVTHNHPEGIKGAQATAAVFLARTGMGKTDIKPFIEGRFGYDFSTLLDATHGLYPRFTAPQ